jgi:hypothetical protein
MFRPGDIVSVTYRQGYTSEGKPILKTLERAEVLGCEGNRLNVGYRDASSLDEVLFVELSFDMKDSDLLVKECVRP